jgi:ribosomal protein L37AE/L43A
MLFIAREVVRIADTLVKLVSLVERLTRIDERERQEREARLRWKTEVFSGDSLGTCPYCNTENMRLYMRGITIFGCQHCTNLFQYEGYKCHHKTVVHGYCQFCNAKVP